MSNNKLQSFIFIIILILTQYLVIANYKKVKEKVKESKNHKRNPINKSILNGNKGINKLTKRQSSNKVNKKSINVKHYKILLLGDVGQFRIFKQNRYKKLFYPGDYVSTMREVCQDFNSNHRDDMAKNFEQVLIHIKKLKNINEAVVLGNAVYPEVKALGIHSKYNKNKNKYSFKYKEYLAEYIYRLNCGWLYLVKLLKNPKNHAFIKDIRILLGNHSYDVNYKTEAYYISKYFNVNHALIANSTGGIRYVTNLNKRQVLYPKILVAKTKNLKILYLDIDQSLLACSNYSYKIKNGKWKQFKSPKEFRGHRIYTKFTHCLAKYKVTSNPGMEYITNRKLNIYLRYLRQLLTLLKTIDREADWRIVRMHQPIFNVKGDYLGIKKNKLLMHAFKKAHIHLWFVAHENNAQVNLSLYENKNYKYLNKSIPLGKDIRKEPYKVRQKVDNICIGNSDPYYDPKFKVFRKITVSCINRVESWLKHNQRCKTNKKVINKKSFSRFGKMYISSKNEDFIIQTLVGNSGRRPDPLSSDKFSDTGMLWGHTDIGSFGYAVADFYSSYGRKAIKINFYANRDNQTKFNKLFTLKVVQIDKHLTRKQVLKKNFRFDFVRYLKDKYRTNRN